MSTALEIMDDTSNPELMPAPKPTQALQTRPAMAVGQAMGIQEILAQVKLIQDVMRSVMSEGEHYGTIPGCGDKKTLLQPGAQKLTMTFRLAPEYQIQETDLNAGHKEYRVTCTLKSITTGNFVGQGVGCCSSMESKYRFRGGARKCPHCGKETIIKGKAEYGGGWLCFGKKGGCGAKWPDGAQEIEGQSVEKVENENPADSFNTVLKMAKKRAFVDATITATAASDIFTQDVGDDESFENADSSPAAPPRNDFKPPQKGIDAKTPPSEVKEPKTVSAGEMAVRSPEERRKTLIEALKDYSEEALTYYRALANPPVLLPNENLEDLPEEWIPMTKKQWESTKCAILDFKAGKPIRHPFCPQADEVPKSVEAAKSKGDEWFWSVFCPIPHKGERKSDYEKNPDTVQSLYEATKAGDQEAQKRLWGFALKWTPGPHTFNGKTYPPSEADKAFRAALDAFVTWEKEHQG